jgi:hypothetical protein
MPRFRALPVVVEAHQFTGSVNLWPDPFLRAVVRHLPGGITEVMTADGLRQVRNNDWLVYGPGGFSVMHEAAFEAMFEELALNGGLERADAGLQSVGADDGSPGQRAVAGRRR